MKFLSLIKKIFAHEVQEVQEVQCFLRIEMSDEGRVLPPALF